MIYLPFQDTTISASRSLAQIVDMLVDIGFSEVAQFTINGVKSVKAAHNGAVFEFVANIDGIKQRLQDQRSRGSYSTGDLQARAEKIAWRILHSRVKCTVDAVKYEVETLAQSMGGRLVLTKANNESIYFADYVVEKIEAGKITAGQLTKPLLIEGKVEK
jgi:hypothetical protein